MEGLFILITVIAGMAVLDGLAIVFGGESREAFVDPRVQPRPSI
jgi:hypothetical protein